MCSSITINSTDEANTFSPGTFVYDGDFNDRPAYRSDEGVYLYFHSRGDCHMWAVADAIDANQWLMYSYDISPRPYEVVATWSVARTSGWVEDDTLQILCI